MDDVKDRDLLLGIESSRQDLSYVVSAKLEADERVISRVTDGIYRQPGSALRELISNAYDADATRVVVKTDAPRFDRIVIEDDGHGMTPAALAHMIRHIGGSAKRTQGGAKMGVTDADDPNLSPGGRRLIGKIGIGLFSVSQLTRFFQIITKVKGDSYRTVASVVMRQYSDSGSDFNEDGNLESGLVKIWSEKATDIDAQGTTIILEKIRPQAKDVLRSKNVWSGIEHVESVVEQGLDDDGVIQQQGSLEPPKYHIGRVKASDDEFLSDVIGEPSLPWKVVDDPSTAFQCLVDSVTSELTHGDPHPALSKLFDYYLQMVWNLSLSVPLPYVESSPFDHDIDDADYFYLLSNDFVSGNADPLTDYVGRPVREAVDVSGASLSESQFSVYVDGLQLKRPIKFRCLPVTKHSIQRPMFFYGVCNESFEGISVEASGGELSFSAYLMWNPKIVPKEHRGVLIRMHGASGTLFDQSFLRYPVNEFARLSQTTCEIFVSKGLEGALNIDRESFNAAHPHVVYLTRWLHGALRQLANANKKLAKTKRVEVKKKEVSGKVGLIEKIASDHWMRIRGDLSGDPPDVIFASEDKKHVFPPSQSSDFYSFSTRVLSSGKERLGDEIIATKVSAIVKILASYDLLDTLSRSDQEEMLLQIRRVLES